MAGLAFTLTGSTLQWLLLFLVLVLIGGGGTVLWARYRGQESYLGRLLSEAELP